eukprot:gnl/TRDRNA2_/TRDRNA2_173638_c0_seq1.p1 gnl/TRDRNA2_/TRDRNA2_173638_c0~~gnl/TRDRNA2_/TRDRNA2_173638_c0_seq1.p1  ORF type:complete len:496 (-),score=30.75 gnl/TRDRNA2_/TRDRNA2_173638_c0_seq1:500-1987(-)
MFLSPVQGLPGLFVQNPGCGHRSFRCLGIAPHVCTGMPTHASFLIPTMPVWRWATAAIVAAAAELFSGALADLPIHCLSSEAQGTRWEFVLGPSSPTRSACHDLRPDHPMQEPLVDAVSSAEKLTVDLNAGGYAHADSSDPGTWTFVGDSALEVRIAGREFLAFFGFDFEHLPGGDASLALKAQLSHCNKTVLGWYRGSDRSSWGCWYGRRLDDRSFLQRSARLGGGLRRSRTLFSSSTSDAMTKRAKLRVRPQSLDWRNVSGQNWVDPPVNQERCGCCYAIAATEMMSARHRIAKGDLEAEGFSSTFPVLCSEYTEGCSGGYPYLIAKWSEDVGLLPKSCGPHLAEGVCGVSGCKLSDLGAEKRLRATNHRYITGGEGAMLDELNHGPLVVSFISDPDLHHYTSGIYHPPELNPDDPGDRRFAHSALLVGYGEDAEDGPYWILQNSWGADWGEDGGFRILRDVARDRGIETVVVAADVVQDERPQVLEGLLHIS